MAMNSSFYGCDDNKSSVYKGSVGSVCDCVAGRLVFLSDGYGSARLFDGAMIAVGTPSELSSFFLSDKDLSIGAGVSSLLIPLYFASSNKY